MQSIIYFSENYRTYWSFTLVIFKPCNFVDITMYTSKMDTSTEVLFYKNYRLKKFLEKNMQNGSIARFSDWLYTFWSKSVFIKKMKQMFLLLLVVSVAWHVTKIANKNYSSWTWSSLSKLVKNVKPNRNKGFFLYLHSF